MFRHLIITLISDLENGSYRGIIDGNTQKPVDGGIIITKSIVIGNTAGLNILNARNMLTLNQNDLSMWQVKNLLYDIKFILELK